MHLKRTGADYHTAPSFSNLLEQEEDRHRIVKGWTFHWQTTDKAATVTAKPVTSGQYAWLQRMYTSVSCLSTVFLLLQHQQPPNSPEDYTG